MDRLAAQPWIQDSNIKKLLSVLGYPDVDVRFVGGCVRDTVLGRSVEEIDLSTPDKPEIVMGRLTNNGISAVPIGIHHGTVTAIVGECSFEVTSLRSDLSSDGRHAVVEYTDKWSDDAARRDFTFNAMSLKPDGTLFDPYCGVSDAKSGHVRFVGDPALRIREDYLRILRFFRFQAHYGRTKPDPIVLSVCQNQKEGLNRLSAERVGKELSKLLSAPNPATTVQVMADIGLWQHFLPNASDIGALAMLCCLEKEHLRDSLAISWLRRLAVMLPLEKNRVGDVARQLRLSNRDRKFLEEVIRTAKAIESIETDADRARLLYEAGIDCVRNASLLVRSKNRTPKSRRQEKIVDSSTALLRETQDGRTRTFPLTGEDVLALGVAAGPAVGFLLSKLKESWFLSSCGLSRGELLKELEQVINNHNSKS